MSRRVTLQGRDWLRPQSMTQWQRDRAGAPTLLPMITDPTPRDLLRSTLAGMAMGTLFGFAIVGWLVS